MCPLCFDEERVQLEDVIRKLDLPSIIIGDAGLGTINSVVLTHFYMKTNNLPVKGIIINHYHSGNVLEEDNIRMCEYMTGLKILAKVRDNDTELDISAKALAALYE